MANAISNSDDVIGVRDVIARFEELEELIQGEGEEEQCREYKAELETLQKLLEDLKGNGGDEDWRDDWYPVMLIRDSHFETAMDELLEDIGELPKELPCYLKITVDYDALQMDYSSVEFEGVTYWYR